MHMQNRKLQSPVPKKSNTYIDIGRVYVVGIWDVFVLAEHDPVVVVWNAFGILVLVGVGFAHRVPARVGLHLHSSLEFELVQDGKLPPLFAQFDKVPQLRWFVRHRLRQRILLICSSTSGHIRPVEEGKK